MLKVYDSYSADITDFIPIEENKVKMYVCGPTVYDKAHLGHARCYITWDMVYRYLKFSGYDVKYCRNVTDVDDKILKKAEDQKKTVEEISSTYYESFKASMEKLNLLSPDIEPFATKCIKDMIEIIEKLIEKGYAYEADGDVYFQVNKFKDYGKLSKQPLEDLSSGIRVELSDKKRGNLDFALWKRDEKHGYESPWGKGRPGWHIECSAMSKKYLGSTIDIHAGGADLIFPHHENELAQSECANDCKFVKYWLHNGFVTINNQKMSKSLANFVTIDDLLQTYDANTIRFFILTNNYRMPIEFNDQALIAASNGVKRIKNSIISASEKFFDFYKVKDNTELLKKFGFITESDLNLSKLELFSKGKLTKKDLKEIYDGVEINDFIIAMDDDFNTSKALAVIFSLVDKVNKSLLDGNYDNVKKSVSILIILCSILGLDFTTNNTAENEIEKKLLKVVDKFSFLSKEDKNLPFSDIMDIILNKRTEARSNKDYKTADNIRDILKAAGIVIKDTKDGAKIELLD